MIHGKRIPTAVSVLALAAALPLLSYAQQEPTAPLPTPTPTSQPADDAKLPPPSLWRGPGPRMRAPATEPTEQELQQVSAFMQQYSPNRWQAFQQLPRNGPLRRGITRFVFGHWRRLQDLKQMDPALYDLRLRQVQLEDQLFGLLTPLKTAAAREAKRAELRPIVQEDVEIGLKERAQRIERLQTLLQREQEKLAADQKDRDAIVDRRVESLVKQGIGFRPSGPGGMGEGPGRGPGRRHGPEQGPATRPDEEHRPEPHPGSMP
jgi:hypothetical protein